MKQRRGYRRGYPVAILIGLEGDRAVLWKVFSNVVKFEKACRLEGTRNNPKAVYKFHESIIDNMRPTLKEGVRSVILASPAGTNHAQRLIDHVCKHHAWLDRGPNKAVFSVATGSATRLPEVTALTRTPMFKPLITETTSTETENLMDTLEKRLNTTDQNTVVLYSLKETEGLLLEPQKPGRPEPEYLMLTNKYLAENQEKNRIHRLIQIAANRNVKTRIVDAESTAGMRLTQLGGMVCFARHKQTSAEKAAYGNRLA